MKRVLYSNRRWIGALLAGLMIIPILLSAIAYADSEETIIIAPEELEGVVGTPIDTSEIFVQRVTFANVENIKDIEVVDDKGVPIKIFPKGKYKAYVRKRGTKNMLGFITLNPKEMEKTVAVGSNLKGEFLFYQNGRVFNKLNLAEEGKLYFYRQAKNSKSRPLILFIGTVKDSEFTYEDYVRITDKNVELRR